MCSKQERVMKYSMQKLVQKNSTNGQLLGEA